MAKIIVANDLHFGARQSSKIFDEFFKKFYEEIFFPYCDKHGINHCILPGDIFDTRKFSNHWSLAQCKHYFFDEFRKRGITVDLIVGNHDTALRDSNDINTPALVLSEYQNITIFSEPTQVERFGLKMLYIPWICEGTWNKTQKLLKESDATVVFGHLEIEGFEMYKNTFVLEGIDIEMFAKFDVVASGHFHHRSRRKNIIYLGAPYPMNWQDHDDLRGANIFDTETKEFTHLENPFTLFQKVDYDDRRWNLDDITSMDFSVYKDKFIKVIVHNKDNQHWFDVFQTSLEKAGPADIKIIQETINLNTVSDQTLFSESNDVAVLLKKYIDQIDATEPEKKELQKFLGQLYVEASEAV